jgi:hypothetical protein
MIRECQYLAVRVDMPSGVITPLGVAESEDRAFIECMHHSDRYAKFHPKVKALINMRMFRFYETKYLYVCFKVIPVTKLK